MGFFDRISNGWSMAMASLKVLRLDPELMLFPLASGITCLLVLASFIAPLFGLGEPFLESLQDDKTTIHDILAYIALFVYYFVSYFVIIFFNSALVSCAIIRFKGGNPTVMDGLRAAAGSTFYIAMWALVAATVGLILKAIESRSENVGRFVAGLLGAAWSMLTYFIVPVVVVEQQTPWNAFNRSKDIMLKTWGETLTSSFSLGIFNFIAILISLVPIIGGVSLLATSGVLGGCLIGLGVLMIIMGVLCTSALESILLAGLYLYAEEGKIPEAYDQHAFTKAFQ